MLLVEEMKGGSRFEKVGTDPFFGEGARRVEGERVAIIGSVKDANWCVDGEECHEDLIRRSKKP